MMRNILLALLALFLVACHPSEKAPKMETAAVLAKTEETNKIGEKYITKKQWKHEAMQKATRVIVVVRTAEIEPLAASYNSLGDVELASDSKQDKTSASFIIYTYAQDEKHKLTLVEKEVIADPLLSH